MQNAEGVQEVLICGTSTRAVAESAAVSGFRVTAIDAFADLDQHPQVRALSAARDLSVVPTAAAMARAARAVKRDAVVYLSPFENHPRAVSTLAANGALWGNSPETLRRVRDPFAVASVLRQNGFPTPRLWNDSNGPNDPNDWLLKPLRSGGGRRVRTWRGGRLPRTAYLQERIDGTPGSLVFVAADRGCIPVGFSRQLTGDPAFGANGHRYCGSILASLNDDQFVDGASVFRAATRMMRCLASEFSLVGMNNIDFVARDGLPYLLEVNPRWSSSVEVAERAFGTSFFGAHADACSSGALPPFACDAALEQTRAFGKAIVYARHDGSAADTSRWLDDPCIRDVPHPGTHVRAGEPVCSVHATGADSSACYELLVRRAESVYQFLERGKIFGCEN